MERLIEPTRRFLSAIRWNGREFQSPNAPHEADDLANAVVGIAHQWISFGEAQAQAYDLVFEAVHDIARPDGKEVPLLELLGNNRAKQLENDIVDFFSSIPREYAFDFKLRHATDAGPDNVEITPDLLLISVNDPKELGYGVRQSTYEKLALLRFLGPVEKGQTVIRATARGYFSMLFEASACVSALSRIKQFVGLGLAANVFSYQRSYLAQFDENTAVGVDRRATSFSTIMIPSPLATMLASISFHSQVFQHGTAKSKSKLPFRERTARLTEKLARVSAVMREKDGNPDVVPLRTAAEWAFDAHAEQNETVAFLFVAIGLEAILQGDQSERQDTAQRLADRLGYLLGRTRSERNDTSRQFLDFYQVRKGIVHGRSVRLSRDQRVWLDWGRKTLLNVLAKELDTFPM